MSRKTNKGYGDRSPEWRSQFKHLNLHDLEPAIKAILTAKKKRRIHRYQSQSVYIPHSDDEKTFRLLVVFDEQLRQAKLRVTDQNVDKIIYSLQKWARDKWGEEMIDPTGPEVGREVYELSEQGEKKQTYTQADKDTDFLKAPHRFVPKWLDELRDLLARE